MHTPERAAQIWSVLAWAAHNRQTLTYTILSRLIGVPARGLGPLLEPIHAFCKEKNLPPLTILVVKVESGMPGTGFTAAQDIPKTQLEVFEYDWLKFGCPKPEELDVASKASA